MDAREHKRKTQEYLKAKKETRDAMMQADRAVHGEDSRVKYDPKTGSLVEEK